MEQLLELRNETEIRTGQLSDEAIEEVKAVLAKHTAVESSFQRPRADLEQLFLRTVRESGERPGRRFTAEEMAATQPSDDKAAASDQATKEQPAETASEDN